MNCDKIDESYIKFIYSCPIEKENIKSIQKCPELKTLEYYYDKLCDKYIFKQIKYYYNQVLNYMYTKINTNTKNIKFKIDDYLNIDCNDCENCYCCINCKNCKECEGCNDCENCIECKDCFDCENCEKCFNCYFHTYNCRKCQNCKNCKECKKCKYCKECENCINCENCILLFYKENCKNDNGNIKPIIRK